MRWRVRLVVRVPSGGGQESNSSGKHKFKDERGRGCAASMERRGRSGVLSRRTDNGHTRIRR
ncbi:unnamed protein product [Nippostrongylus brasiliensis]|uniref:Uncharacterized protein n=1 Tax=Nippostrongylus brasiliensis TaxID=27835 RepID=A0A0N4XDU9_NIPBR|nr:unnamed protein product [Nippostrongylus brasiliensis]